jgi:hypothetical protein
MDGVRCAGRIAAVALCALVLTPSVPLRAGVPERTSSAHPAPYPPSRVILAVHWSFSAAKQLRKADGSDIWPCTWALDDALYCAWGDGGGFQGTDGIGRVSLGFARVTGAPRAGDASSFQGKNLWGAPPYADHRATFGGKVGTLIAIDGAIYGAGSLWTQQNAKDPVDTWEAGTLDRLIWSYDLGKSWHIAPWTPGEDLGSYVQFGRDRANAPGGYIYAHFSRPNDPTHVYLKRIAASELEIAPERRPHPQYLAFASRSGDYVSWSPRASDAIPVFTDPENAVGPVVVYDAGLERYLMTIGHFPSGRPQGMATGELGVFEAPHPWGPWSTVYYGDDWGRYPAWSHGDYLGLTFPVNWISADGRVLWGVFSGPGHLDAFNLVRAQLVLRDHGRRANDVVGARSQEGSAPELVRCRERHNGVNGSTFADCRQ